MNGYSWNSDWIQPYESTWGIIEKFKYANCASNAEFLIHFAREYNRSKNAYSYWDLYWINPEQFVEKMNFDIVRYHHETLNNISGIFVNQNQSTDLLHRANFTFCPICIRSGYHSTFHQLLLFKVCPFHGVELTSKCPQCGRITPYQLENRFISNSFKCCCEYSFVDFKDPFSYSAQWKNIVFSLNNQIKKWIIINTNKDENTKAFFLRAEPLSKLTIDFSKIVSVVTGEYKYNHGIEYHKIAALNRIRNSNLSEDIEDELYFRILCIFKVVARQIKKKTTSRIKLQAVKTHRTLIRIDDEFFNRFVKSDGGRTLGYLLWRSHVENQNNFSLVETKMSIFRYGFNHNQSPYRRCVANGYVYQQLIWMWSSIRKITKDTPIDAFCLFDRIVAYSLLDIYENVMSDISERNYLPRDPVYEFSNMSMVTCQYNEATFEFYFFRHTPYKYIPF